MARPFLASSIVMWRTLKGYLLYTWGIFHRYFGNQNNVINEYRHALHFFTRAYETNPRMRQARLARATILWRELERIDEAIVDLDALLQQDPAYGPALLNRAMAYQQSGHYEEALADIEDYLQLPADEQYEDVALRMEDLLRELVTSERREEAPEE